MHRTHGGAETRKDSDRIEDGIDRINLTVISAGQPAPFPMTRTLFNGPTRNGRTDSLNLPATAAKTDSRCHHRLVEYSPISIRLPRFVIGYEEPYRVVLACSVVSLSRVVPTCCCAYHLRGGPELGLLLCLTVLFGQLDTRPRAGAARSRGRLISGFGR